MAPSRRGRTHGRGLLRPRGGGEGPGAVAVPPNAGQRNRHRGKDGGAKRGDKRMQSPSVRGARAGSGLVATSSSPAPPKSPARGTGVVGRGGERAAGGGHGSLSARQGCGQLPVLSSPSPSPHIGSSLQEGLSGEGKEAVG